MMVAAPPSGFRFDLRAHQAAGRGNDLDAFLRDHDLIESFRELRRFLDLPLARHEPVVLATTAALHDEGASGLALGLAASLAYDHRGRVLLVDCDFERPSLHARLRLPNQVGITEILAGETTLEGALHETVLPELSVLTSGQRKRTAIHSAQAMQGWLLHVRAAVRPDYVVLDLPPVNVDLGTRLLAKCADVALVIARGGVTPRDELRLALEHLREARVSVVVNGEERRVPRWIERLVETIRGTGL